MSQRAAGFPWVKMKYISLLLFLILLFFSGQIQGSIEMIQVFLPTGVRSSICFADDLPKDYAVSFYVPDITIGTCYCDEDPKLVKNFTGNVELSCPATLIFPSPQESDSGVYSARVMGDQYKKAPQYNVTFQDPVSPVQLKVNVSSKSSCDLKVTCSTEDVEINGTVRCVDKSCRLEGGERSKVTKSGASLRLFLSNESIICNHSNQVSWIQNKTEIQPCSDGSMDRTTLIAVITVVAGLFVAAITVVVLWYCRKKRQTGPSNSQMLRPAPQVNGAPRVIPESDSLMEENTEESSV